jgi:hypothetical protein
MSQNLRSLIKDFGDEVTLYAGYERGSGTQLLFIGETTTVSHSYDQPEIITTLECLDGDKILNNLRVTLSYEGKISARQIVMDIAKQVGLNISIFAPGEDKIYTNGKAINTMAKDALADVCAFLGMQASVQNNFLQIIPLKGSPSPNPIIINENTGMQGIPQWFTYKRLYLYRATDAPTTGYKVNITLNPLILPGQLVQLESNHLQEGISGRFRVENIRHEGDTWGQNWFSNLELIEI